MITSSCRHKNSVFFIDIAVADVVVVVGDRHRRLCDAGAQTLSFCRPEKAVRRRRISPKHFPVFGPFSAHPRQLSPFPSSKFPSPIPTLHFICRPLLKQQNVNRNSGRRTKARRTDSDEKTGAAPVCRNRVSFFRLSLIFLDFRNFFRRKKVIFVVQDLNFLDKKGQRASSINVLSE